MSVLVLYAQLRLQNHLPLNPDGLAAVSPALAFNTAVSFLTNTNWQAYSGEVTMSHLTQMAGLAFHNFVSAACGAAVVIALIRGLTRRRTDTIGNFWVDLVRTCTRVLLPFAFVGALFLVSQGVIQNFHGARTVATVEGGEQAIPGGPIASQEAIKEIGQNGGGPYNANSAHPFENPNPITNIGRDLDASWPCPSPSLDVRHPGQGQAPGLRGAGGHVRPVARGHDGGDGVRDRREPPAHRPRGRLGGVSHPVGREHGGQGGPLRPRRLRAVRGVDHRARRPARSTPCTTATRPSAARSPW